jgi:hypothetical protein
MGFRLAPIAVAKTFSVHNYQLPLTGWTVSPVGDSFALLPLHATDPPSCAPAWRRGQGQATVLRNLDRARRGRTAVASAPREMSPCPTKGNDTGVAIPFPTHGKVV